MKQIALLLGKIFLFMAVPFAFVASAVYIVPWVFLYLFTVATGKDPLFVHFGWQYFFLFPILMGVAFGVLMALILGLLQYFQVKKVAHGKPLDLSPIQHRTLIL
jgi:predicted membrane protein